MDPRPPKCGIFHTFFFLTSSFIDVFFYQLLFWNFQIILPPECVEMCKFDAGKHVLNELRSQRF